MGSGASSHVKVIEQVKTSEEQLSNSQSNLYPETDSSKRPTSNTSRTTSGSRKRTTKITPISKDELKEMNHDVKKVQVLLIEAEGRVKFADAKMKEMELQMSELESQNLELQDKVCNLEEQVDVLEQERQTSGQTDDFSETLLVKDQQIAKLENESQAVQADILKLKRKFKKRLRLLNTQLSEAKQGQSVQAFETRDELQRLTEENKALHAKLKKHHVEGLEDESDNFTDGRTQIILELSARVSEQEDKIITLERNLAENERLLNDKTEGNGHSEVPGVSSDTSVWSTDKLSSATPSKSDLSSGMSKKHWDASASDFPKTLKDNEDTDELRSIAQEMKTFHNGARPKKTHHSGHVRDYRESSGISRDSGIVETSKSTNKNKKHPGTSPESDWGDSDSDLEFDDGAQKKTSQPSSAISRSSVLSSALSNCSEDSLENTVELDPSSIRRISAAKMRKSNSNNSSSDFNRNSSRPPVYQSNSYGLGSKVTRSGYKPISVP